MYEGTVQSSAIWIFKETSSLYKPLGFIYKIFITQANLYTNL
jgi:hypothetical protein